MFEIEIIYKCNNEHDFIYGYSVSDALRRNNIDEKDVIIGFVDFID